MKHLTIDEVTAHSKDIPAGEIFAIHAWHERKSAFIYTPSTKPEEYWALGMKVNGRVYTSDWISENEPKSQAKKAMKQILAIKLGGWYDTGETKLDDEIQMERVPLFRCAYCFAEKTEPKGACSCRPIAKV